MERTQIYNSEKFPFIPTEQEIDLLIASCGKTTSTVLQMLKETGIRIGELTQLKWIDLDSERKTVNITPEKHSNPRILPISDKLIAMLTNIQKTTKKIFSNPKNNDKRILLHTTKRHSRKTTKPKIIKITFHTFRHWKGTMEYHKTKDIMHVKKILGHKTIKCTEIYINIESALFLSNTDEWTSKVSHSLEEEQQLIDAGFQLVRSINETTAIYKKRK